MKFYQIKVSDLAGTDYHEVYKRAVNFYKKIKQKTKRRPYVRSVYFNKDKIFLDFFWKHVHEKLNHRDKLRRIKYFPCAIELIQKTKVDPESKENVDRKSEILHRFAGKTAEGEHFFVQIKEDKRTGQKALMSVFPVEKKKTFR